MTVASIQLSLPGANPFKIIGPSVAGDGIPLPQFRLGAVCRGDDQSEFVLVSFTPAGATTLVDGNVMQIDKTFVGSLLTTATGVRGQSVGICRAAGAVAAGATVWLWLQVKGQANVLGSASSAAAKPVETTATAGQVNAPASATTSALAINRAYFQTAVGGGGAAASEAILNYPDVGAANP